MITVEQFNSWLEKNGCKDQYYDNIQGHNKYVFSSNCDWWLDSAFCWSTSDEGHDYWGYLNKKYLEFLEENNK